MYQLQPNWPVPGNFSPVIPLSKPEGNFIPRTDVLANSEEILYVIEVPGVPPGEVGVEVRHQVLYVHGPLPDFTSQGYHYLYQERPRGSFSRSLSLPPEADGDRAAASFRNGLLEVRFPRKESGRRLNVAVQS
ncbi:MAG: hypothetical protein PWP65_1524 [Clostridia bacterium]|nr:hypothetical protein [Clostridia bacterium]